MLWVEGGFGGRQADPVQQQIEEALPFCGRKEVSVGSRTETLKAQAVIARTNLWGMYLKIRVMMRRGKEIGWSRWNRRLNDIVGSICL